MELLREGDPIPIRFGQFPFFQLVFGSHLLQSRQTNLEVCLEEIRAAGYAVECFLLNSSWFGLPQSRERVYIVCLSLTHSELASSAQEFFENFKGILKSLYLDLPNVDACRLT